MNPVESSATRANTAESWNVKVEPSGPLGGYVVVPPSKNYTTRFILAATLAEGPSVIHRPASNDDARALIACCRKLGAEIDEQGNSLRIRGVAGTPRNPGVLNPGNAGAVLRLLLGAACLVEGEVRFETDHPDSLGKRPNEDLLSALRQLGAEATGQGDEGLLPITIEGGSGRVRGGNVKISGARSSQFLSSLLFLTPHLEGTTTIEVTGNAPAEKPILVSRPLIDQTLETLRFLGVRLVVSNDGLWFTVPGGQTLRGGEFTVPGDWPSASALMSAVAVASGMVGLRGLRADAQGERRAKDALFAMGCVFSGAEADQLFIHGKQELRAVGFNGDLATDAVLALMAAACCAEGTSRFAGVGNLRIKESDRIAVPLEELAKIGVRSRHGDDWIEITGNPEGYKGGIEVDCRGDHRIAQMLTIVGLRCEKGLTLRGAQCVSKSYPEFFEDLGRMGVKLKKV